MRCRGRWRGPRPIPAVAAERLQAAVAAQRIDQRLAEHAPDRIDAVIDILHPRHGAGRDAHARLHSCAAVMRRCFNASLDAVVLLGPSGISAGLVQAFRRQRCIPSGSARLGEGALADISM